jgi:hypothetical protein
MESPAYYHAFLAKAPSPAKVVDAYRFALLKWAAGVEPSIAFGAAPHVVKAGWHVRQRVEGNRLHLLVTYGGLALYGAYFDLPDRGEVYVAAEADFRTSDRFDSDLPEAKKLTKTFGQPTVGLASLTKARNLARKFAEALATARLDYLTEVAR